MTTVCLCLFYPQMLNLPFCFTRLKFDVIEKYEKRVQMLKRLVKMYGREYLQRKYLKHA